MGIDIKTSFRVFNIVNQVFNYLGDFLFLTQTHTCTHKNDSVMVNLSRTFVRNNENPFNPFAEHEERYFQIDDGLKERTLFFDLLVCVLYIVDKSLSSVVRYILTLWTLLPLVIPAGLLTGSKERLRLKSGSPSFLLTLSRVG